jgi:hypothetical protein
MITQLKLMKPKFLLNLVLCLLYYNVMGQQWDLLKFTDIGTTSANVIARDEAGNIYVAGSFTDSLTFNNQKYGSQGNWDGFILALNQDYTPRWIRTIGNISAELLSEMKYKNGVLYIGGTYSSISLNFQVATLQNNSPGTNKIFTAAMDTLGNFLWASSYGAQGTSDVTLRDLHVSDNGIFYAGSYQGIFDGGNNVAAASSGSFDSYLLKKDLNGSTKWGRFGYGVGSDFLSAVTTDLDGNIYCAGSFGNLTGIGNASISLGSFQLTAVGGFGYYDMFIAKYDSSGLLISARRDGGNYYDIPQKILYDQGKLFIGGSYYFTTILNGVSYNTNGGNEGFVYCLDTVLFPQWSNIFTTVAGPTSYYDDVITDIDVQGINQYYVLNQQYGFGLEISLINGNGVKLNSEQLRTQHNSTYESSMVTDGLCERLYITSSFTDSLKSATDTITGGTADAFIAIRTDSASLIGAPQNIAGTAPDTICADYPLFNVSVDPLSGAISYGWQIIPQQAGFITGMSNQATVNINDSYGGSVSIVCFASTACLAGPASDTLHYFVKPTPPTPAIIQNGVNLTANTSSSFCNWYFNGNLIPGANGINYSATQNGGYQVSAVVDGCESALSPFVTVTNVGIDEFTLSSIQYFPNPASDLLQLRGNVNDGDEFRIITVDGQPVLKFVMGTTFICNVATLDNGYYLTEIYRGGKRIFRGKLVIIHQ